MGAQTVVVGYADAELLDISCVTTTLAMAVRFGADPPYAVRLLSPGGVPITCPPGLRLEAHGSLERHTGPVDTLVVVGGYGHTRAAGDDALVAHVRRLARTARRVSSVCTGATVLAAAGLLDGHRATTHWAFATALGRAYPAVTVDPDPIFVRDGRLATSAGVTSALDLTLSFVAEDHGPELARRVARAMVTYLQRPGSQAQMSMHVTAPAPAHEVVREVLDHVARSLDADCPPRPWPTGPASASGTWSGCSRTISGTARPGTCAGPGWRPPPSCWPRPTSRCRGWPPGAGSVPPRRCARRSWTSTGRPRRSTAGRSACTAESRGRGLSARRRPSWRPCRCRPAARPPATRPGPATRR